MCKNEKENKKNDNFNDNKEEQNLNVKNYKELAKDLIFNNIEKPLNFHIMNLKQNKILLSKNQIKWLLQKIRESNFPNNEKFLQDISKILITFENNKLELKNIPFCFKSVNTINIINKNKLDKYIIFTSIFQINLLFKCTQVLVDGTFKSAPKTFYQILNISGFYPDINSIIPIFMIPMSGKSEYLYNSIFKDIKNIITDYGFDLQKLPNKFMADFEKPLQNAIKKNFPRAIIDGCFFHYVKLLWAKSKKIGLCKIKKLKKTKLVLFIFKLIPFMEIDTRNDIFNKLEDYIAIDNDENYNKLIKYYKKNWINNEFINYIDLSNEEFLNRTNNYIEAFHSSLNQSIDAYHPKLSYLVYKYKLYIINIYDKIKECLINKIIKNEEKFSIINDIYTFMIKYKKKYKTKFNFNLILQSDEEQTKIIYKIADYLLDIFFDINIEESNLKPHTNIDIENNEKKNEEKNEENNNKLILNNEDDSSNELLSGEEDINGLDNKEDLDESLHFDIMFPKKINKKKKAHILKLLVKITN